MFGNQEFERRYIIKIENGTRRVYSKCFMQ